MQTLQRDTYKIFVGKRARKKIGKQKRGRGHNTENFNSFCSLTYNRPVASSQACSPNSAI
jgi:hypothetical protein